jgi:hypothetical protein
MRQGFKPLSDYRFDLVVDTNGQSLLVISSPTINCQLSTVNCQLSINQSFFSSPYFRLNPPIFIRFGRHL